MSDGVWSATYRDDIGKNIVCLADWEEQCYPFFPHLFHLAMHAIHSQYQVFMMCHLASAPRDKQITHTLWRPRHSEFFFLVHALI